MSSIRLRACLALTLALGLGACSSASLSGSSTFSPESRPTAQDQPASAVPAAAQPTWPDTVHVLALGDSVMSGFACDCEGPADGYAKALSAKIGRPVELDDQSGAGATSGGMADMLEVSIVKQQAARADLVIVIVGANDVTPSLDTRMSTGECGKSCYGPMVTSMGRDVRRMLDNIRAARTTPMPPVLLANYWDVLADGEVGRKKLGEDGAAWTLEVTAAANRELATIAKEYKLQTADLRAALRGPDGAQDPTALLADDGDHPNAAGVARIVKAFIDVTPAHP